MRRYFGVLAGVSVVAALVSSFIIQAHLKKMKRDLDICELVQSMGGWWKTCQEPSTWMWFITVAFGIAAAIFLIIAFAPRAQTVMVTKANQTAVEIDET